MFTATPRKNKVTAREYFDEHLSPSDYYSQTQKAPCQWVGEGLIRLDITEGERVGRDQFGQLCDNLNPKTGKLLTQVMRKDGQRRVCFDFTCSAPKSVSIMAVTMNDVRILKAHEESAALALKELERFAASRVRKNHVQSNRTTANLVGAAFTHTTSRALDPQLHTHFVLFNCTFDTVEGCWKALETRPLFDAIHYGTELYRNELARRLNHIGYQTRKLPNGFEIEGVSASIQETFSKRSKQRDQLVAAREQKLGRRLSNNEIAHIVYDYRPRKVKGITDAEVRKLQLNQLTLPQRLKLGLVKHAARERPITSETDQVEIVRESVKYSTEHCFERNSVVAEHELLRVALVKGCGQLELDQLKKQIHANNNLVRVGDRYSTRAILETELYLIQSMNGGKNTLRPIHPSYSPSQKLGGDQREAVQLILESPDQFTGIRGLAGSGKSTALGELAHAVTESGYQTIFVAPTTGATDVLIKDGHNAITLARLLIDESIRNKLTDSHLIVLDEAGAVGIDDMKRLFQLAQERRCRVVFCGDTGQHSSVARGDALRILEEHSRYAYGRLTRIRRQQRADYAEVVELAANKKSLQALSKLRKQKAVTELPYNDLHLKAARAYVEAIRNKRNALLISPTWKEIDALTAKVRETLQTEGMLGKEEETVPVLRSLSWTQAQKANPKQYEPGQRIVFHASGNGYTKHEQAEVTAADHNSVRVKRSDGSEQTIDLASAASRFDVFEARTIPIAVGDRLMIQTNRGHRFTNGELVEVKDIRNGVITLTDNRVLPEELQQFCHGYAVTSQASQGRTVDDLFLVASTESFGAVSREQFYVSISRGRERCRVFTDDIDGFANHITTSRERAAAVDLSELQEALVRNGYTPVESERPIRSQTIELSSDSLERLRPPHLSTAQWIQQMTENFNEWVEQLQLVQKQEQSQNLSQRQDGPHRGQTI